MEPDADPNPVTPAAIASLPFRIRDSHHHDPEYHEEQGRERAAG